MTEEWIRFLPPSPDREQIKGWAVRFAEVVVDRTSDKLATATAKAIKTASGLLRDPEYQENLKKRRASRKQQRAVRRIEEKRRIAEQEKKPPAEQVSEQLHRTEQYLEYHKRQVRELQAKVTELKQLQIVYSGIKQQMN
jgi:hypothetical protein